MLFPSELDELLEISDRIGVIYRGRLVAIVPRAAANPALIGHLMLSGAEPDQAPV